MNIPKDMARVIVQMEEVCYSEGIGPDSTELMKYIGVTYPDLKAEFGYLPWPGDVTIGLHGIGIGSEQAKM